MVTVVNTPPASDNSSGPMSMIIGLVVLLIIGYLLLVFGLPAFRQSVRSSTPQINVPDQIDVNVNQQPQ